MCTLDLNIINEQAADDEKRIATGKTYTNTPLQAWNLFRYCYIHFGPIGSIYVIHNLFTVD